MTRNQPEAPPASGISAAPWEIAHASIMVCAMVAAALSRRSSVLAAVGAAVFAHRVWSERGRWLPMRFGWPNAVTALRVLLVVLLGVAFDGRAGLGASVLALLVFALDALDGWLARRLHQSSEVGASLDMEADAFFVAMLTVTLAVSDVVGPWVLLGGLLRYAYVLVVALCPRARGEVPRNRLARSVFGLLVSSLSFALLSLPLLSGPVAAIGTGLVTYSFARSFWWSFRGAPPAKSS